MTPTGEGGATSQVAGLLPEVCFSSRGGGRREEGGGSGDPAGGVQDRGEVSCRHFSFSNGFVFFVLRQGCGMMRGVQLHHIRDDAREPQFPVSVDPFFVLVSRVVGGDLLLSVLKR